MKVAQRSQSHCLETWIHISSQLKHCSFPSSFFLPHSFSNWLERMSDNWPIFLSIPSCCTVFNHTQHAHRTIDSPTMMSRKREMWLVGIKQQEIWLQGSGKNDPTKTKSLPRGGMGLGFLLLSFFLHLTSIHLSFSPEEIERSTCNQAAPCLGDIWHPHLLCSSWIVKPSDKSFDLPPLLLSSSLQALAHKTLVLLLGVDPSKQLDHPLPTAHPHVTYAYMKYMWKSSRKVRANKAAIVWNGDFYFHFIIYTLCKFVFFVLC